MAGLIDNLSFNQQAEMIYIGYFNRAADAGGFNFWAGQNTAAQQRGQSAPDALKNIANSFAPQPETDALYPFLTTGAFDPNNAATVASIGTLVDAIYNNLFGHAADTGGRAYWVTQLVTGSVALGASILAIANGATGADAITVQNKINVALDFTTRTGAANLGVATAPAALLATAKSVLTGVDGVALQDSSVTTALAATSSYIATATNTAPTITGSTAGLKTTDVASDTPFASVTVVDPDTGANETVTITVTAGGTASDANGLLSGSGLTKTGTGTYSLAAGTPAAVTAALKALTFTPTVHEAASGTTFTTGFTLSVSDGIASPPTADSTTTVVVTESNNPPTITGTTAGVATSDIATTAPFAGVKVADPDTGASETVTITVTAGGTASDANGLLSGSGLTETAPGTYLLAAGTPAAVTAALEALTFTPTVHEAASGTTITTGFALSVSDGIASPPTTDSTTTVVVTESNNPPTITGTTAGVATSDTTTKAPFASVTVTDPDPGANETVTITVTAGGKASDANGLLSGSGLAETAPGTYLLAAGTPAAVTAALEALTFTPTAHEAATGTTVTTGFTLSVSDGIASQPTVDSKTTVVATQSSTTLTLGTDMLSGTGGTTFNAPILFNAGTATQITTLQAMDSINATGANNQLNLFVGANDKTISGEIISGVQTINISSLGFTAAAPILQGAGITGLTTVTNDASTTDVSVGSAASPLATPVTTVGVTNTPIGSTNASASPNTTKTTVITTASALAAANDALMVNVNGAGGSATTTALVLDGPSTGTNGYEAITVNAAGTDFVGLGNPVPGVNTTNSIAVIGSGTVSLFGDGSGNDFTNVTNINLAGAMGAVTITGAATLGTGVGLLTGDTSVKTIVGGSGADTVDISSMSLTNLSMAGTTVDLKGGRNTLIVNDAVATTAVALAGASNVQILGDSNPGSTTSGAVDFSKGPSSIDTFQLFGNQSFANAANPITLINAPSTFTFNASTFGVSVVGGGMTSITAAAGVTSGMLNIVEGSTTAPNTTNESYTLSGYQTVTITPQGGASTIKQVTATATGGSETLIIAAVAGQLTIGSVMLSAPIRTITDKDTAQVIIGPTNAGTIDATASGGLLMTGLETGNSSSGGVVISGSTTAGNILVGSTGADTITGGTGADVIVTGGGGDMITLGATHSADRVEVYGLGVSVPTVGMPQTAAPGSIVNAADYSAPGFWSQSPTSAVPINIFTVSSTSIDQSTVMNFSPSSDVIDFSLSSFTLANGTHRGLTTGDGYTPAATGGASVSLPFVNGTLGTSTDLFIISPTIPTEFNSASQLVMALKSGALSVNLAGAANANAGDIAHLLFAYNDSSGSAHIADVAVQQSGTSRSLSSSTNIVAAQDLVKLTGVSDTSLTSSNVHIFG